jgi:hypothetical protein
MSLFDVENFLLDHYLFIEMYVLRGRSYVFEVFQVSSYASRKATTLLDTRATTVLVPGTE